MSNHTPGPWKLQEIEDSSGIEVVEILILTDDVDIAQIYAFEDPETISDARADADLIAAAPDMLKALELIKRVAETHCGDSWSEMNDTVYISAREAIEKARGNK